MSLVSLNLGEGLEIGYTHAIAAVKEKIELSAGVHYLLARNGRGKTTLMRTLSTAIPTISGKFSTNGVVQYVSESMYFDKAIPAKSIFRAMVNKSSYDEVIALAEEMELDVNKPYGQLSTGNRQKVSALFCEFSMSPQEGNILLLDEPFTGLDAVARKALQNRWYDNLDNVLRLVACHPDHDSMQIDSCVLISEEEITHITSSIELQQTWNSLKNQLL